MSNEAFRIIDCSECGEEFNIAVTNVCPECKAINSQPVEFNGSKPVKKKYFSKSPLPPRVVSMDERLESIERLLLQIQRDVSFFSRVLFISLVVGYIWIFNSFN
jgi:ABC-type ATPase with predicted acetyltransferase domain